MNRRQGAVHTQSVAQLFQRHVGGLLYQFLKFAVMVGRDFGFTVRVVVARGDIPRGMSQLEQFFDHPERNHEPIGDFLTCVLARIVGGQDSFS